MKQVCTMAFIFILGLAGTVTAQQGLVWSQSPGTAEDHLGGVLAVNSLCQLIVTTVTGSGGTPPAPDVIGHVEGLNTGEAIAHFVASLAGGNIGAFLGNIGPIGGEAAVIYARIYEQPSANATDDLPVFTNDGPNGPGEFGLWYADMPVVQIVPDLGNSGLPTYSYLFDVDGSVGGPTDWQWVVAIPEPGTLVLAACGLIGLAVFRRRK